MHARLMMLMLSGGLALGGCASVQSRLPVFMGEGNTPLVEFRINRSASREFVLDTGASNTTIQARDAEQWRLPGVGSDIGVGSTGSSPVKLYRLGPLHAKGFVSPVLTVAAINGPRFEGRNVTGLAGVDLFASRIVEFDFPNRRIIVHSATKPQQKHWKLQQSVWLRPWKIMVPVTINGVEAMGFVDTGAQISVANLALARAAQVKTAIGAENAGLAGVSGDSADLQPGIAQALTIGPQPFGTRSIHVGDLPLFDRLMGSDTPQIMLGMDLLKEMHFTIDYKNQRVYLSELR